MFVKINVKKNKRQFNRQEFKGTNIIVIKNVQLNQIFKKIPKQQFIYMYKNIYES